MQLSPKIKNFFVYGLGQSVNLLSPLIVMPWLVKICGEDGLGKIGIAFAVCLILCSIVDYSSYLNGTREISVRRNNSEFLSQRIAAIYSYKFILLVFILAAVIITVLMQTVYDEKLLLIFSLALLISQFLNPGWVLQGVEDFGRIAVYNIISKVIYIILILTLIRKTSDYIYANLFLAAGGIIVFLYGFIHVIRKYNVRFSVKSLMEGIKTLKQDTNIFFSEFLLSVYQFIPVVIVGAFAGYTSAGLFRIIEQITSVFRTYIFMYFNFSYPNVCNELEYSPIKGMKTWKMYHMLNLAAVALGCLSVAVFAENVLDYFNVNASDSVYLVGLLRFALLIPVFLVISQALRQLLLAKGNIKTYTRIIYTGTILNFILMVILVHFYDLKGAFMAILAVEAVTIGLYLNRSGLFSKKVAA